MVFEMVGRQSEIGLVPHDPDRMLVFYRDTLGLSIHSETPIAAGMNRRFLCGRTVVKHLCLDRRPPLADTGVMAARGLRQLTLVLADFDNVIGRIESETGAVAKTSRAGNVRRHFTQDPDGNALELVGLENPPPGSPTVEAGLTVSDPAQTRHFYETVLGRELVGVTEWRGREVTTVKWGSAQLKFWKGPPGQPLPPPVTGAVAGIRYLTALVDDVDGVCAQLSSLGVAMPMPPRAWEGRATIAFITDPDGVLIEFGGPVRAAPKSAPS
ncbi:MAG: VOC family protein [Alphaproteobacteria bacterium]|nr:VOC family protein [Alphaproteobacteria bacterium]